MLTTFKSAREFLEAAEHQVGFPEHEEVCRDQPHIHITSCIRCRIEVVMGAYAVTLLRQRQGETG